MGMLEQADEEMKKDWKFRWLCRWEMLKLSVKVWWIKIVK